MQGTCRSRTCIHPRCIGRCYRPLEATRRTCRDWGITREDTSLENARPLPAAHEVVVVVHAVHCFKGPV